MFFVFYRYGDHRDLHVLTHSFPTRRSSDLRCRDRRRPGDRRHRPLRECLLDPREGGAGAGRRPHCADRRRSEEHTSELQSLMRISYAVFCLKKKILHTCILQNLYATHGYTTSHTHISTTCLC